MNNPVFSSLDGVLLDKCQTIIIKYPEGKSGNYTIPNSVTSIGASAFIYSVAPNNLIIPESVTNIGSSAFTFSSISGFYFKGSPPWVSGFYAFSGLTNATVHYLPGIAGWEYFPYGSCSMAQWLLPCPLILNNSPSFGVKTNMFCMTISWATNIAVVVEASTNLINWQPVQTNTLTAGSAYFSDPQWTNYPGRFYRLRSP
jgi:hypothetical protein